MNIISKFGLAFLATALTSLPSRCFGLDVVADIPLGNGIGPGICSAMAVTDSGAIFLAGQSSGSTSNSLWILHLNGQGVMRFSKTIHFPSVNLACSKEIIRDLVLCDDRIFALLEWEKPGSRLPTRSLAIAELDRSGEVHAFHVLPFSMAQTRMAPIDSHSYALIGQNPQPFGDEARSLIIYRLEYSDPTHAKQVTTSYKLKMGESLADVISLDGNTFVLLTESSILVGPATMRLLKLSIFTGVVTELDVVPGGNGNLMNYEGKTTVLSYRAPNIEWNPGDMGDWLGEGHARIYGLPDMNRLYDVILAPKNGSSASGSMPVFSLDKSTHLIGALVSQNGHIEKCLVLSEITYFRIKRQLRENNMQYLLSEELMIDPKASSGLRGQRQPRLLVVSSSSIAQEKTIEALPATIMPSAPAEGVRPEIQ